MGLAIVELMMAMEERFGIDINDEEAPRVRTVDDAYQLILRKRHLLSSEVCLSSNTFYRARKALMVLGNVERAAVRPDVPLEAFFPYRERWKRWEQCAAAMELSLPSLVAPRWLQWCRAVPLLAALVLTVYWRWQPDALIPFSFSLVFLLLIPAIALWGILCWLTRPLAVVLPCRTVRDFVTRVTAINYRKVLRGTPRTTDIWSDDRVWHELIAVIVDELRVAPEDITPATHLYDLVRE